jgi:subtilisin-like proprotein convertase family protein
MLVICYGDFMTAMQPFVEWKKQMGIPCEMVSVAAAGGTAAAIKSTVLNYYNTHDLAFVLLVGDAAQCPSFTVSNLSDPTYSLLVGSDNRPEILVGRFSAENVAQVDLQVTKAVEYEKRPQAGAAWYHKGTGIASNQGPGDDGEYDNVHIDNIRTDLLAFTYTLVDQIYDPTGTAAMVTTALNDGRSVIHYCGHGSVTAWGSTGFSNTNVNALVNDNMLPFIFSVACVNGQFGSTTCFAEAWLRASHNGEPTGAVGAYMATINQSWNPPMDAEDEFADLLVGTSVYGVDRTFGGLCFNGSNHMMDVYGTSGENEFLHWTVFGDPSLRVRTATPASMDVTHLPAIFPGMTTFDVTVTGVQGALCALYYNGTIYGAATTNASGLASIPVGTQPVAGTTLTLTVTAFNKMTYIADVPVLVPSSHQIVPPTIPVAVTSAVTVTVWDGSMNPMPNVVITIDGWGIDAVVDTTDVLGEAHFSLTPPYGESLTVIGREIGETYNCVEDVLPVTGAASFAMYDIAAGVPLIGLSGSLTPYYEGEITGATDQTGFDLFAAGCGVDAEANSGGAAVVTLLVTPTSVGTIHAAIGKSGYNVYAEDIPVQVVYGTMAGEVYEVTRAPIVGARVKGYAAGADTTGATPVFNVLSGTGGAYTVTGQLAVGHYDVYVSKFGYLTLLQDVFIEYGANDEDFYLQSAPSGVVSGVVTEAGTGTPLYATVKAYRLDTMTLYAETTSDGVTGEYELSLPYFSYQFQVRATHHIPAAVNVVVNDPTETADFVLDPTSANILVISDGVARSGEVETVKMDKSGNVLDVLTGASDLGRSAAQISTDLVALGYDVVQETAAATNPATWPTYDFIVWAAGDNTAPIADATKRAALESYVLAGGKLLIEGGEVGYKALSYPTYPTFAQNVLHCSTWNHDSSGSLRPYNLTHPLVTTPNALGIIAVTYVGYGDQDSVTPRAEAVAVCDWSTYPGQPGVVVYDDNPAPQSGQIVFYTFDYLALGTGRVPLLENTVNYLTALETPPDGSIAGRACLEGEGDHSGIKVTATPGGNFAYTAVDGTYVIEGMYDATYTVTATKDGWSTAVETGVVVSGGLPTGGVDFLLYPTQTAEQCISPALGIPDNNPTGVYSTLTMLQDVAISDVEIYLNLTHTYIGDLIVEIRSPEGTTVRLHNRGGGSADNIIGWYDSTLPVAGPGALSNFTGQHSAGEWRLWVSDNASIDVGTVNTWCVKVVGGAPTAVDEGETEAPVRYELVGARPNPFNPMTSVVYGAPQAGAVRVSVYSAGGREVRVLVDGPVDAGYHEVVWDGRDGSGTPMASGVYFVRMDAPGYSGSVKAVLLK